MNDTFMQMLKSRRIAMGPGNRAKTKHYRTTKQWLYPSQYEKVFSKEITKLQKLIIEPLTNSISLNIDRWIESYKNDTELKLDEDREDAFSQELQDIIDQEQQRLNMIYGEDAPRVRTLITGIGNDVSDWNLKQEQKFIKDILGVEFFILESWESEVIKAWSETNFNLIKSLSDEYIKKVNTLVSDAVQFGGTGQSVMKDIRKLNKQITGWRSELIAQDQIGKLNGVLTKRRMNEAGIDMYIWQTAADERVRGNPSGPYKNAIPSHYAINGKICRWDDNTVYSEDGVNWQKRTGKMPKAIPGEEIRCRCGSYPYFDDMIEKVDKEIIAEQEAA